MSMPGSDSRSNEKRQASAREMLNRHATLIGADGEPLDLILMDLLVDLRHMVDTFTEDEVCVHYDDPQEQWRRINDLACRHWEKELQVLDWGLVRG
mgnify:CR=1 FL=1